MRHSLYKFFSERKWAEAFLDGEVLFRSLAYFRDYEDENVRRDKSEGNSIYKPEEGLLVTNQTQGKTFTMPGYAFEATANQEEIFVFCTSRSLSDELSRRFEATVCVEILKIPTFCERVRRALPVEANWHAGKVEYYDESEGPGPRWALPDLIARSKRRSYQWQHEYRFVFCLTDALGFEKGTFRLAKRDIPRVRIPPNTTYTSRKRGACETSVGSTAFELPSRQDAVTACIAAQSGL